MPRGGPLRFSGDHGAAGWRLAGVPNTFQLEASARVSASSDPRVSPARPARRGDRAPRPRPLSPSTMPDLLLTHGYFLREDPKEQQIMKPYPTLGLLYLSAYLRRAGFDVE